MSSFWQTAGILRGGFLPKAATVFLLAALGRDAATAQGNFSVNYAPTGIAFDAANQRIAVSGSSGETIYDTNGTAVSAWTGGATDLGGGTSGTVWLMNGTSVQNRDYFGNSIASASVPFGTAALGRELNIGGTNYLMYFANNTVYAMVIDSGASTALCSGPAGFTVTGGDWTLRPGGRSLQDVAIILNSSSAVNFLQYFNGAWNVTAASLNTTYGAVQDVALGQNFSLYAVQYKNPVLGNIVRYDMSSYIEPVPAAAVLEVGAGGGAHGVYELSTTNQPGAQWWRVEVCPDWAAGWTNRPVTWATNGSRLTTAVTNPAASAFYRLAYP